MVKLNALGSFIVRIITFYNIHIMCRAYCNKTCWVISNNELTDYLHNLSIINI